MPGTLYSHSRLACFEQCPRKFRYRYIDKIPVDSESIEAFVGKLVHAILERLYRFVAKGQIPSLGKVLKRFHTDFDEAYDSERIRIVREDSDVADYVRNGEICLQNHYRRNYPFDRDETLDVEHRVMFSLDDEGGYRVQGFIDRLCRSADGGIEIHDFKTGRYIPKQEALDQDRQLALYQMGIAKRYPGKPVRLVWHYLLRNQMRISTRSPEQIEALREATVQLIDQVEAEASFEPRTSPLCKWCEYGGICPKGPKDAKKPLTPLPPPEPAREAPTRVAGADDQLPLL